MFQLSGDAIETYRRDGFVRIDRLVSPEEATRLHAILMRLYKRRVGFEEGALFDAAGVDDGNDERFPQMLQPRLLAPELANSEYHMTGLAVAKQILGHTARLSTDILFLKPPHIGSDTPWHQDVAFCDPTYDHEQITIWLALTPADSTNSCMSFVPGSNNFPVLNHQPLGGDPRIHALECISDFDKSNVVECPLTQGGCTIHGIRTLHYAGPNTSDRHRLAYVLIFDTVPVFRKVPHDFPWRRYTRMTARAQREQRWRRRGGIFIHALRQRHGLNIGRGLVDLRRIFNALVVTIKGR